MNLYLLDDLVQDIKASLPYSFESYLGVFDDNFYDSKTVSVISENSEEEEDEEEMKKKWGDSNQQEGEQPKSNTQCQTN